MSKWKEYRFSDVIEIIGGGTPKTSNPEYWNGKIPWLSVADFNTGRKYVSSAEKTITEKGLNESSTKLLNSGDIIISARGTVGVVAVLGKPMAFNQSCYGIRAIKNLTNTDFVYYLLKDTVADFQQIAYGGVFDTITRDTFKEIEILLPPLSEQKSITAVLSSLDDKIDLLHRQNATLENMAETLFRQWFVEEEKDEWESYKLKDLVKHVKPGTNYQPKRIESGVPFINVRNLSNGFLDLSDTTKISKEDYLRVHKNWKPEENDLLISRIGTLGIVAVIQKTDLPVAIHYNMINLKAKKTSYQFLYFLLKSQLFQELYFSNIRQSVQEYVAIVDIENIEISLPFESDEFKRKETYFIDLYNKIKSNQNQILTLTALRDTLLPKLMSGKIQI